VSVGERICPRCGASERADAAWCSLCHASFAPIVDPLTAPLEQVLAATGPQTLTAVAPAPEWLAEPDVLEATTAPAVPPPAEPAVAVARPPADDLAWTRDAPPTPQVAHAAPEPPTTGTAGDPTSVDAMLAMLAVEQRNLDNRHTPWAHYFDDKSSRVMVMVGGSIGLALGLFVVMAILGAIF